MSKHILRLFNTLNGKKEVFKTLIPNKVMFYVCGVTVYDVCHIGHARAYVSFDIIHRYLKYLGYEVQFIQNFTDIDDKIIARANRDGVEYTEITQKFIKLFEDDMTALGLLKATANPRATDYIDEMISFITSLIEKGHAYQGGTDVFFSVESFESYGKLSKKVLEDLEAGTRVDVNSQKRNPLDFVLWKSAKPEEPSWESPWGVGRPGWHIECSTMVYHQLGPTIDIHAGGADLIFPHHENEIAQSECFTEKPFAQYWMHNGFVNIKNEKMSKSLGNFVTIQDVLTKYTGEILKFYLLRVHYRTPLRFSSEGLDEARLAYQKLKNAAFSENSDIPNEDQKEFDRLAESFHSAMHEDFNAAEAIGFLFEMARLVNRLNGAGSKKLLELGQILGLFGKAPEEKNSDIFSSEVHTLVAARQKARKDRDFQLSDQLRNQLREEYGILLKDGSGGHVELEVMDDKRGLL